MTLRTLLDEYLEDALNRAGLSKQTCRAYSSHLRGLCAWFAAENNGRPMMPGSEKPPRMRVVAMRQFDLVPGETLKEWNVI